MHNRQYFLQKESVRAWRNVWTAVIIAAVCIFPNLSGAADLPPELTDRTVMDSFIPLGGKPVGIIHGQSGSVVVDHARGAGAYRAAKGDALYAGDVIYTLADGRCRLRFVTDDVITMGIDGRISIDQVLDERKNSRKRSRFSMLRGKAVFYVMRLLRYRQVEAEVATPTAVCGVRGTKFGVEIIPQAAGAPAPGAGPAAPPPPPDTVVLGFDGTVAVTSTADGTTTQVGAGQQLGVSAQGAGVVGAAPAGAAAAFLGDVSVTGEGEGAPEPQEQDGGGTGTPQSSTSPTEEAAATQALASGGTDFTQNQTTQVIQESVIAGKKYGYFSALLTRYNPGPPSTYNLADIYTNSTRTNMDGTSVMGKSIVDGAGSITAFGTSSDLETTPYVKQIKTLAGGPADTGDLGTSRQMDNPENSPGYPTNDMLGKNDYMEWGFWRMSKWVQPGGAGTPSYAVTERSYHMSGIPTSDAAAAGIVGTYGGQAWGTYWSGTGGTDMVGTFSCDINVPSHSVSNFNLSVSDGGAKTAGISGGTGSFIGTSGEFTVTGGTWAIGGGAVAYKSLVGSLFGPGGEHVGGAWAMDKGGGNNAAVGIFAGDKNGTPTTPAMPTTLPALPAPPP
ncbi:MAG: FecR domain-containing protein [Pseudomonadota bacterium]